MYIYVYIYHIMYKLICISYIQNVFIHTCMYLYIHVCIYVYLYIILFFYSYIFVLIFSLFDVLQKRPFPSEIHGVSWLGCQDWNQEQLDG